MKRLFVFRHSRGRAGGVRQVRLGEELGDSATDQRRGSAGCGQGSCRADFSLAFC